MTGSQLFINRISTVVLLLLVAVLSFAQDAADGGGAGNMQEGKTLFRNQCATCHNRNMKDNMTGPALVGTQARWAAYPKEDLYNWIRNAPAMISAGHPRAVELWNQYKPNQMQAFPNLTDAQIDNILAYVDGVVAGAIDAPVKVVGTPDAGAATAAQKPNNTPLFIALAIILAILAVVLARIISTPYSSG